MPSALAEIIKYSIGNRRSEEMLFKGILYNPDDALKLGIFHDITDHHNLMDMAMGYASEFTVDNMYAYSAAKKVMRNEVIDKIHRISDISDKNISVELSSDKTVNSLRKILKSLRKNN